MRLTVIVEIDEARQDDSFAERLRRGMERDRVILRRLDEGPIVEHDLRRIPDHKGKPFL